MKAMKILKTVLVLAAFFFFIPKTVQAAYDAGGVQDYKSALESPELNNSQWTLNVLQNVSNGLTKFTVGYPVLENEKQVNSYGAAGVFAGLIDGMYQNKPISSTRYLAYLKNSFSVAKPAYARGEGWEFLQPVMKLWKGVRDLTYLFFVVIFVAVGFMIMFRKKIDPQTAISVQNALPKVIISLILVTFSYAICGFMVDLIFLGNGLMNTMFADLVYEPNPHDPEHPFFEWNQELDILNLFPETVKSIAGDTIIEIIKNIFNSIGEFFSGQFNAVFQLVVAFVLISSVIKIFLSLLQRYVMILLYTIASPFLLMWGSLPGQKDHIGRFFKSFLGMAITFPAIFLLFQLTGYFVAVSSHVFSFTPLKPFNVPVGESGNLGEAIGGFIALGILMAAAKIPESIDDLLEVKAGTGSALGAETAGILKRFPIIGGLIS